jgi:hypothetical protein
MRPLTWALKEVHPVGFVAHSHRLSTWSLCLESLRNRTPISQTQRSTTDTIKILKDNQFLLHMQELSYYLGSKSSMCCLLCDITIHTKAFEIKNKTKTKKNIDLQNTTQKTKEWATQTPVGDITIHTNEAGTDYPSGFWWYQLYFSEFEILFSFVFLLFLINPSNLHCNHDDFRNKYEINENIKWLSLVSVCSAGFRINEALCLLSYEAPYLGPEGGTPGRLCGTLP